MTTCDFSCIEMMQIPPRIGGNGETAETKHAYRIVSCLAANAAGNEPAAEVPQALERLDPAVCVKPVVYAQELHLLHVGLEHHPLERPLCVAPGKATARPPSA